jgi:hypothetical protein
VGNFGSLCVFHAWGKHGKHTADNQAWFLEATAPYELGEPPPTQLGTLFPAYLRGQAHLSAMSSRFAVASMMLNNCS